MTTLHKDPGFRPTRPDGADWQAMFDPKADCPSPVSTSIGAETAASWPDPEWHLDLRELDLPRAVARLLAKAGRMAPGEVLFALLAGDPAALVHQLERRGHQWVGNFDDTGETYRILIRAAAAD